MQIVNLTPHEITLVGEKGIIARIAPSGQVARVQTQATGVGAVEINGYTVPVVSTKFGEVEGLPDPSPDTFFLVSLMVAQASKGRNDLLAPDTTPESVVRDEKKRIIGVRRFIR